MKNTNTKKNEIPAWIWLSDDLYEDQKKKVNREKKAKEDDAPAWIWL